MNMQTFARLAFLTWLLFLCSCEPPPPAPGDHDLENRLAAAEPSLLALMTEPSSETLRQKAGIIDVSVQSANPPSYYFAVWQQDLVGPGGYAKGYYYSESPPQPLVDSTDEIYAERPAEQITAYRHIRGPWYIYYAADN